MAWWRQATSHYLSQYWPRSMSPYCTTRSQCVNSLRLSDAYMLKKLTIIGSDNGLSPGRRQAIIWSNAGILLIGPLRTNFSEILIEINTFSFKKMHSKLLSAKWRPSCLGLNVLTHYQEPNHYLNEYWPTSTMPCDITKRQWVKWIRNINCVYL